jgi:hypothetical protein
MQILATGPTERRLVLNGIESPPRVAVGSQPGIKATVLVSITVCISVT